MIGIVDYAKQKDLRSSYNSGNAMCYYGHSYRKYPESVNEGDGFKQGDLVEVEVNRASNSVKYFINGALKAQHTNQILADSSRIFMPYVDLYHTNDTVEWVPE